MDEWDSGGWMTDIGVIWQTIRKHAPRKIWLSIAEVCAIVEDHAKLDSDDLVPGRYPARLPKWKANVRRILKTKKKEGEVRGRTK